MHLVFEARQQLVPLISNVGIIGGRGAPDASAATSIDCAQAAGKYVLQAESQQLRDYVHVATNAHSVDPIPATAGPNPGGIRLRSLSRCRPLHRGHLPVKPFPVVIRKELDPV